MRRSTSPSGSSVGSFEHGTSSPMLRRRRSDDDVLWSGEVSMVITPQSPLHPPSSSASYHNQVHFRTPDKDFVNRLEHIVEHTLTRSTMAPLYLSSPRSQNRNKNNNQNNRQNNSNDEGEGYDDDDDDDDEDKDKDKEEPWDGGLNTSGRRSILLANAVHEAKILKPTSSLAGVAATTAGAGAGAGGVPGMMHEESSVVDAEDLCEAIVEWEARAGAGVPDLETAASVGYGTDVWMVTQNRLTRVNPSHYGKFTSGDAYIVLTRSSPLEEDVSNRKTISVWDLFYWIGSNAHPLKAGVAAAFAADLGRTLRRRVHLCREVQNEESDNFRLTFPKL